MVIVMELESPVAKKRRLEQGVPDSNLQIVIDDHPVNVDQGGGGDSQNHSTDSEGQARMWSLSFNKEDLQMSSSPVSSSHSLLSANSHVTSNSFVSLSDDSVGPLPPKATQVEQLNEQGDGENILKSRPLLINLANSESEIISKEKILSLEEQASGDDESTHSHSDDSDSKNLTYAALTPLVQFHPNSSVNFTNQSGQVFPSNITPLIPVSSSDSPVNGSLNAGTSSVLASDEGSSNSGTDHSRSQASSGSESASIPIMTYLGPVDQTSQLVGVGGMDNIQCILHFNGRQNHNEKERERRSRIANSCQAFRNLIPGIRDKTDKATVFEYAVHYVTHLRKIVGSKYDEDFLKKHQPY